MAGGSACLLDSNILLRISKRDDPQHPFIAQALKTLVDHGVRLCYTSQTLAEFWNASTRPVERNGFALAFLVYLWWGRRFRLPAGAGPSPVPGLICQASRYGIGFNVADCAVNLIPMAEIMIERFILPKRKARPVENQVCGSCCRPFQPAHYLRNRNVRSDEEMDMIGHNDPAREFIKVPLALANQYRLSHKIGNRRVLQP